MNRCEDIVRWNRSRAGCDAPETLGRSPSTRRIARGHARHGGRHGIARAEDRSTAPGGRRPGSRPSRPSTGTSATLLDNAMRYVAPENQMVDPVSGYPFEGWNQDPTQGLFLRSFTQLTAIGQCMELLANVAAGHADTPVPLPRAGPGRACPPGQEPAPGPARPARSAPRACSATSSTWPPASGSARWPSDVEKHEVPRRVRPREGRGDLEGPRRPRAGSSRATTTARPTITRDRPSTAGTTSTARSPRSATTATKQKIMAILDQRVVMIVFGDNANLSASAAKTIGALLHPAIKDRPEVVAAPRASSSSSSTTSARATPSCTTPKAGLFYFGWDATRDRLFGWDDLQGNWVTGHVDYLVNEFRGPATFVVARFGLPARRDQEPRLQDEAVPDAGRPGRLRPGPLGGLGVPGAGPRAVADRARRGRAGGRCWRTWSTSRSTTPRGTSCPASSRSRTPARASSTPAASASPRSPSPPGPGSPTPPRSTPWASAYTVAPDEGRAVPGGQLAGRVAAAHRPRPLGGLQRTPARK